MRRIGKLFGLAALMMGMATFGLAPKALAWGGMITQPAVIDNTLVPPVTGAVLNQPAIVGNTLTMPSVVNSCGGILPQSAVFNTCNACGTISQPAVFNSCNTCGVMMQPACSSCDTGLYGGNLY